MDRTPSPNDSSAYLENLTHAGQQSMKRFDDALATAMGVHGKNSAPKGQVFSPFAFAMDVQREYVTQFWRFWNAAFIRTITGGTRERFSRHTAIGALKMTLGRRRPTTIFSNKTKAELREMLTEAVRNTQPEPQHPPQAEEDRG
jgi:hypothetical protein